MKLLRIIVSLLALAAFAPAQQAGKKAEAKKEAAAPAGLIDVNSADAATLKSLAGIGDAYAEKIIKNRPYRGKDEIVSKAGVPQATYEKIKDKIIARQGAAKK